MVVFDSVPRTCPVLPTLRADVEKTYTSRTLSGGVTSLLKFEAGGDLKFFTDVHHRKTKLSRWPDGSPASSVNASKLAWWQKN